MNSTDIAIYGASGFGREVAWLVESCNENDARFKVVCFIDDDISKHGKVLNNIPVMALQDAYEQFPHASVVSGIGDPQIRECLMNQAEQIGFKFETLVHPRTEKSTWVEIGLGTVICAGNILTTNIVLGQHVQINLDCTLGHDVILHDYATLAPGVHVSGCVHIGKRAYIGTGAVIINGTLVSPIVIGDDAVVGAGACVTKSVDPGLTVVGIPAKPLKRD
jgi:sugar O-acyltransferase (sialic acid O-acetyltransferase NeuD family)